MNVMAKPKNTLIVQGEHAVSRDPDMIISTLLGSCVSCCLWDETAGVGGMNHLVLAGKKIAGTYDLSGVADMEVLINGIIKQGGRREQLKAKVFGGAQVLEIATNIGANNAEFVIEFLRQEGIECVNSSVGGKSARTLKFWPTTGRVSMRMVDERVPEPKVEQDPGNDMELF